MKLSPSHHLLACLVSLIIGLPAFGQGITVEPNAIDFGRVPVGLSGLPGHYQAITVTNESHEVVTVQLSSSNLARPECFELFSPEAAAIHPSLRQIYDAVGCYRQDYGEDPNRVYDLVENGYLHIEEEILWHWQFSLIGQDPITQIEAQSSDGIIVIFDVQTGRFFGSFYDERQPFESIELDSRESREFMLSYAPIEYDEVEGRISFIVGETISHLNVTGTGFYREALELSTRDIDFGNVYDGRRISRDLILRNTAGVISRIGFEVSEPGSFYVYDDYVADVHDFILEIEAALYRYRLDRNEDPNSFHTLIGEGYLIFPEELERQWSFRIGGRDTTGHISAVSTSEFQRGAGHVVILYLWSNEFDGYGFNSGNDIDAGHFNLGTGRSSTFNIGFAPNESGDFSGILKVRSYTEDNLDVFQNYQIRLSGNGLDVVGDNFIFQPTSLILSSYPSPFNSSAVVSFQSPSAGITRASLLNVDGKEIWLNWIPARAGATNRFTVEGAGLSAGTYWLKLDQNGRSAVTRMVLVK